MKPDRASNAGERFGWRVNRVGGGGPTTWAIAAFSKEKTREKIPLLGSCSIYLLLFARFLWLPKLLAVSVRLVTIPLRVTP